MKKSWVTFKGKKVSIDTIDHQHLSNCYWFGKIVGNLSDEDLKDFISESKERFNGQLLPYRPHVDFKFEINELKKQGALEVEGNRTVIYFKGSEVGEIRYMSLNV